ncbi:MAG: cytochrome c3 family protein [Gammaproteobacteria bacterium]|nr:cytochrome c3 family protein [Gammaproteobacteria bacterium]MDH5694660.1 cytochrome c3 family protein [Gammaproteobacteria bacterium]
MAKFRRILTLFAVSGLVALPLHLMADGWDAKQAPNRIIDDPSTATGLPSAAIPQMGGITNTRHNLTQAFTPAANLMNLHRNNYYEVCVYCHTPHGANRTAAAPLWNRTVANRSYVMYSAQSEPTALGQTQTQPGPNSLTCLSCHDGATAIDSIINMPTQMTGAGNTFRAGYRAEQEYNVNDAFLDSWSGNALGSPSSTAHAGFNTDPASSGSLCMTCHSDGPGATLGAPNFEVFSIGDKYLDQVALTGIPNRAGGYLGDDHPIGVKYPSDTRNTDYNEPNVKAGRIAYFDLNGDNHADPNEIRLYDTGDGYEVECGSCHDPHGVAVTASENRDLIPSFLRVGDYSSATGTAISGNSGSKLCLTCHVK